MRDKFVMGALFLMLLSGLMLGSLLPGVSPASGAPAEAVLTPVANNNSNGGARFVTFFNGTPISVDTKVCSDLSAFDVGDYQYIIKQTVSAANQTTVTVSYSNVSGSTNPAAYYIAAQTLLSGTPGPASTPISNMGQIALFGKYLCAYADLNNATPVSLYLSLLGK